MLLLFITRATFIKHQQLIPTLKNLIKNANFDVPKKAQIFTEEHQIQFLRYQDHTETDHVLQLKMVLIHGIYGGLRCGAAMKPLTFGSHKVNEDGIVVKYIPGKFDTKNVKYYLLPKLKDESICPYTIYLRYSFI